MTDAYNIGCMGTDSLSGRTYIFGQVGYTFTSNAYACFQVNGNDYQVTSGKTFYLTGIKLISTGAVTNLVTMRYADDATLSTNPVTLNVPNGRIASTISAGTYPYFIPIYATIPAGKYVGVFSSTTGSVDAYYIIIGYEA